MGEGGGQPEPCSGAARQRGGPITLTCGRGRHEFAGSAGARGSGRSSGAVRRCAVRSSTACVAGLLFAQRVASLRPSMAKGQRFQGHKDDAGLSGHEGARQAQRLRHGSGGGVASRMGDPPATRRRGAGVMQDIKVPREHRLKLEEDSAAKKGGKTLGPKGGHEGG